MFFFFFAVIFVLEDSSPKKKEGRDVDIKQGRGHALVIPTLFTTHIHIWEDRDYSLLFYYLALAVLPPKMDTKMSSVSFLLLLIVCAVSARPPIERGT